MPTLHQFRKHCRDWQVARHLFKSRSGTAARRGRYAYPLPLAFSSSSPDAAEGMTLSLSTNTVCAYRNALVETENWVRIRICM